jgi:hypothetical protein
MDRNLDIVLASQWLFACPATTEGEQPRSGTWATVRMAKRERRLVEVLEP